MRQPSNINEYYYPYLLTLLWVFLMLPSLGLAPLFDYDETIYAQTAIDMMRQGEWIVPTANGVQFFEKPPFTYYLMDVSFTLFGENAFAARFPSALFTLFTSLLIFHFGRKVHSASFGLAASLIFLTMLEVGLLGHAAILDAVLNFFIAACLIYYFLWRELGEKKYSLIAAAMMGAAVSIKGPVGVVVPVLVITLDRLLARDLGATLKSIPWLPCITLFLLTATPWYLMILFMHGPGFLYEFIVVHNIGRALNPMQGHGGGWHYYLVVFVVSVLPWLAWFIWSSKQFMEQQNSTDRLISIARLGLVWTISVIILFTFAQTKLPHYISSIYPGTALMIAATLFHYGNQARVSKGVYRSTVLLLLPVALVLLSFPAVYPYLATLAKHPRAIAILTQDIYPSAWISLAGIILLMAVLWLGWHSRNTSGNHVFRFSIIGIVLQSSLLIGIGTFAGELAQAPTMRIAEAVKALPASTHIYSYNLNAPSVSFYARRGYTMLSGESGEHALMKQDAAYAVFMRSESRKELDYLSNRTPLVNQGGFLMYLVIPDSKPAS